ncbi:unnamed protein product, partial [Effrenium voratum]
AAWRAARQRSSEVQQGLYRLGRWTMLPVFRRFVAYVEDRKRRRQTTDHHGGHLQSSATARRRRGALRWWQNVAKEVRRERRMDTPRCSPEEADRRLEQVTLLRHRHTMRLWHEALLIKKARLWQDLRPRLVMQITGQSTVLAAFLAMARRSRRRREARQAQEKVRALCDGTRLLRSFDEWAKAYEHESSSFFAGRLLGRFKLSRILERWKQHTSFRAGFESHVSKTFQELQRQRLHRTFDGWRERLKLRRLVAGMWLERRKSWSGALFSAWGTFAQKASSQRQHLRAFKLRVKFRKASRAAKQQRVRSDASWLRRFFRAYALWVQRARRLQARARPLALALQNARKARRLGAWAVHGRALHVSSQRAVRAFRAWLEEARRNKALSWASRSLVSDRVLRAWKEGFQGLHSWFLSRRTLRAMIGGRRTTLLSSVLYCWVAALLPGRHAASELQRRLRTRQLLIFDAWLRLSVLSRKRGAHAEALQDRSSRVRGTEVALAWLQHGRRRAAAAQLGAVLARANTRWIGEEEWMRRALVDKSLQSVFQRFAEALDQQGSGPQAQGSLMMRGTFQSVVAMVWARQQLSVVLGRLRGYFQPWLLGLWPKSAWPLLAPNDPYFLQAEIRLRVMMSKLDAVRAQEQGPAIYKLMQGDGSRSAQRLLTWQALADLLVVHHPGVRQNVEPVATKGVVALPQFGNIRLDPKQRAWLLPFGCGDLAGGPDSGSESAVSFGTPAFGSGDQAAGILAA